MTFKGCILKCSDGNLHGKLQESLSKSSLASNTSPLSHEEEARWTTAIFKDDAFTVEVMLNESTEDSRKILLDGHISSYEPSSTTEEDLVVSSSWCLAGVCTSFQVLSVLLKHEVNVKQVSSGSKNIIHCLVHASKVGGEEAERRAMAVYEWLCEQLPIEVIKELLFAEDKDGLRPMELAAYLCTFRIADMIIHTEGVYKTTVRRGLYQDEYFDVTDYESRSGSADRSNRSPLSLHIASPFHCSHDTQSLLHAAPVRAWEKAKVRCNVPFIWLWFFARILTVALFIIIDLDIQGVIAERENNMDKSYDNNTMIKTILTAIICPKTKIGLTKTSSLLLVSLLTVFSCITILTVLVYLVYDILKFIQQRFFKEKMKLWTSPLGLDAFNFFQLCSAIATLGYMAFALLFYNRNLTWNIAMQVMVIINMPLFFLEIFYFTIFLEKVGHFAAIIHQMIRDLIIFLLVFCGFIFTQAYVLQRIVDRCYSSSLQGFFMYFYFCLKILISTEEIDFFPSVSGLYEGWHLVYIIFGSIMLFNFLIALFTETFNKVVSARSNILSTARLCVIYKIESLLTKAIPAWYRFTKRKFFVCHEGRIYIKITRYTQEQCFSQKYTSTSQEAIN